MSASESELLRQIAQYAGAINRHERKHRPVTRYNIRQNPYERPTEPPARALSSRNKSLVFDGAKSAAVTSEKASWISARDRGHMTLTNPAIYEVTTASKLARINDTRENKRKARLLRREAKEAERLKMLASKTLVHEGATYRFNRKANLLVRIDLENIASNPTPLSTSIHGVDFLKSPKSNNLFRKTTIKLNAKRSSSKKGSKRFCKYYTRYGICLTMVTTSDSANAPGICTDAKNCPYVHDAAHRAVCTHFLSPHGCDETRLCNLSHDPVPENTPICTHHLTSSCNKPDCRYAHFAVSASAPICPEFARNGWCARGAACSMRHLRECPLFSNKGVCKLKNCKLPHIARASRVVPGSSTAHSASTFVSSDESASESDFGTDEYESEDFDEHAFGEFVRL